MAPSAHAQAQHLPPEPEPRKGPKKIPPTPEQVAKVVTVLVDGEPRG
jgi:hypothetical protein